MRHAAQISTPTRGDALNLVEDMRPEDERELVMSGERSVYEAVLNTLSESEIALACRDAGSGDLMCLCGVIPTSMLSDEACIWELGTNAMRMHPRTLIANSASVLKKLMDMTPAIRRYFNYMPSHYTGYMAWAAKHCGAVFDWVEEARMPGGVPFRKLVIEKGV